MDGSTGSDAAAGDQQHPFKSLSAAIARLPDPLSRPVTIEWVAGSETSTGGSQIFMFRSHDSVGKTPTSSNETDSTMTIRIKKSDADDLAAGKITEDEFRKRAKVAIY